MIYSKETGDSTPGFHPDQPAEEVVRTPDQGQLEWQEKVRKMGRLEPGKEWVRCPDGIHGWARHPDWDLI